MHLIKEKYNQEKKGAKLVIVQVVLKKIMKLSSKKFKENISKKFKENSRKKSIVK